MSTVTPARTAPAPDEQLPRWARIAQVVAAAWAVAYAIMGIRWMVGGSGNPGDLAVDPGAQLNLFGQLGPSLTPVFVTVLAVAGAWLTIRSWSSRQRISRSVAVASIVLGLVLAVAVPDYRVLGMLGYAPILLVEALSGNLPAELLFIEWPDVNLVVLTLAGMAWAVSGTAQLKIVALRDGLPRWAQPDVAARWGRWAAWVAIAIPLGYSVTRYAWALGVPLGVTAESFEDIREIAAAGAGLATGGVVGAFLTWGLTRPWGERLPGWVPVIGGRPVPVSLAVVPATLVAAAVTSAGLMFVRVVLIGEVHNFFPVGIEDVAGWLPEMFWPLWGVALAAATVAYVLRREGFSRSA